MPPKISPKQLFATSNSEEEFSLSDLLPDFSSDVDLESTPKKPSQKNSGGSALKRRLEDEDFKEIDKKLKSEKPAPKFELEDDAILESIKSAKIKMVIFDFDKTLLKISSDDFYPIKTVPKTKEPQRPMRPSEKKKMESAVQCLRQYHLDKGESFFKEWFADLSLLKRILNLFSQAEVESLVIVSSQSAEIIKGVLDAVQLPNFEIHGSVLESDKAKLVSSTLPKLGKALYLDDNDKTVRDVEIFCKDQVISCYVEDGAKIITDNSKAGLNAENWSKVFAKIQEFCAPSPTPFAKGSLTKPLSGSQSEKELSFEHF